ncbi:DUF1501 domain-containing protein [Fodinicola acaciae]|uniref:DUF1501 domain-containing protein n=1 Tax=Fodinicola acaciae TaxID=2681555 RepID=UPI0013D16CBB|nr:DUF1501 domain-containing protein [Fodinicola acaciae]
MDLWTRRKFLIASGVTAGAALAAGATAVTVHEVMNAAQANPLPGNVPVLVLVTLYGGNDGLNTVVPASDPAYRSARPDLAYAENEVLPLSDGLGLNPAMKGLKALWDSKELAIVRGVSYPKPDHSHFRSMAIWQTASPSSPLPTGWLGRWLDGNGRDPLKAIAVGSTLPPLLAGAEVAGAVLPLDGISLAKALRTPVQSLSRTDAADPLLEARAAGSMADLLRVDQTFAHAKGSEPPDDPDRPADGNAGGGQSALAAQLDVVAKCIAAGAPTRAYSVSLGGFDTHSNEKGTQSRLLGELDTAVSGFLKKVSDKVVVAVYSEFGRRVAANANQGTDHGTAGPLFVAGGSVKGGFYGDEPSLTKLDDGDLAVTTDFRDVYATLVGKVLGTDPGQVLGAGRQPLGFL